ncbi:adaptor protein MecA [Carnobacteriaceae bacterium zg-84]|uniref:adaptor protein MecA n=1 Tax=Granulicatella sp. zg-84 TaxID=2678503 RepID=UPI0013C0A948|nr:adaptor protein MecA [Granulicatella sp. zg-84]NEW66376.1 hypothetical protein [Granulicatella sp. zg-84]QMI86451.1 adaptor protein MecA [Carnobacteriaceae bacterium zg-84]
MKMEHINENTIKVMIAKSDLEERGITFFDLLGSQKKVETFFYSILDEVGMRHEFEGIDSVTFQVVPKRDGFDLYITKGMVDNFKEHLKASIQDIDFDSNNPLDKMIQYLEQESNEEKKEKAISQKQLFEKEELKKESTKSLVFVFEKIADFVSFAKYIKVEHLENHLYDYNGEYYWVITCSTANERQHVLHIALEYGEMAKVSQVFLNEHANLIIESNALDVTKKYFIN